MLYDSEHASHYIREEFATGSEVGRRISEHETDDDLDIGMFPGETYGSGIYYNFDMIFPQNLNMTSFDVNATVGLFTVDPLSLRNVHSFEVTYTIEPAEVGKFVGGLLRTAMDGISSDVANLVYHGVFKIFQPNREFKFRLSFSYAFGDLTENSVLAINSFIALSTRRLLYSPSPIVPTLTLYDRTLRDIRYLFEENDGFELINIV